MRLHYQAYQVRDIRDRVNEEIATLHSPTGMVRR